MNSTLKNILYFVVLFVVTNELVRIYFNTASKKSHRLVQMEEAFNHRKTPISYLFLGHSRPLRDIDAAQMENSFNFCSSGEDISRTYYKLKHILAEQPDAFPVIVLPIGYPTLSIIKPEKSRNNFYWSQYVDYLELGRLSGKRADYASIYIKAAAFPYYEYPFTALKKTYGGLVTEIPDSLLNQPVKQVKEILAKKALIAQNEIAQIGGPVADVYLEKILALQKDFPIRIVFVKYPVTRAYTIESKIDMARNHFDQNKVEKEIISAGFELLDYHSLFADSLHYFTDAHHLNQEGRIQFTQILNTRLNPSTTK